MREVPAPVDPRNPHRAAASAPVLIWFRRSCARVASGSRHRPRWAVRASPGQLLSRHRQPHRGRVLPCERHRRLVRPHGRPPQQKGRSRRAQHGLRRNAAESRQRHGARREKTLGLERSHLVGDRLPELPIRTGSVRDQRSPPPTSRQRGVRIRSESVKKPHRHDLTGWAGPE
jgi:hypothetical protein